jgi:hypothetical protein
MAHESTKNGLNLDDKLTCWTFLRRDCNNYKFFILYAKLLSVYFIIY